MPADTRVRWIYTLLDGQAALALESTEIKDMCTEGIGARLPRTRSKIPRQGGNADRMGEAVEQTFGLTIMKMRLRWLSLDDRDLCSPVCRRKG